MAISANDIRRGMILIFEGEPCKVMEFQHKTPGNLRAMVQTRMRNLRTGNSFEHRFSSSDKVDKAVMEQHQMEYLYSDGDQHHFMNTENYEQIALNENDLGDAAQWLIAGLKIDVEFYEGSPIGIELPMSMELTVVETDPILKSATVSNSNKPAKLENGVSISVPPFITEGEKIRVNPAESKYIERVK
jgi:elongation factor P